LVLAFLGVALFGTKSFAGEQDFTLVNDTGLDIHQIFVSQSASDEWNEDILGVDVLTDGSSATITFSGEDDTAFWDIKVVDGDGNEAFWRKLNLKKISQVTLSFDDEDNPVASVE
jgi:hypothetical protein